jgi:hypothetical protein
MHKVGTRCAGCLVGNTQQPCWRHTTALLLLSSNNSSFVVGKGGGGRKETDCSDNKTVVRDGKAER